METGGREGVWGGGEGGEGGREENPHLGNEPDCIIPLLKSHPGNELLLPPQIPTLGIGYCFVPLLKSPPWECLASYPSLNPHPESCLISLLESPP